MSTEQLAPALRTETTVCQPNTNVSSTVITKRNQQVYTQQITTRRIIKGDPSIDSNSPSVTNCSSLVPMDEYISSDLKNSHVDVKRTTKTYCRRIIRKIGPNGEVTEQIIEEGDPIPSGMFPPSQPALENSERAAITSSSNEDFSKSVKMSSGTKFQASAGFKTVSETGEQNSAQISTGPMEFQFNNGTNKMLSLENDSNRDETDCGGQLSNINNSGSTVQQVLPDGSIVTRKFYGEKTATVTHSSTINGETKTSSKSAFMCFSGESMLEAKSSINDMEMIFSQMMKEIKGNTFDIFSQFIGPSNNNMVDHLAMAGGDTNVSLLALEPPPYSPEPAETGGIHIFKSLNKSLKAITSPETIHEQPLVHPVVSPVSKDQQEEALIQKQIQSIKDSNASNRLYWSNMDEVKNSGLLNEMKKEEIHLQEAIFEVITSEASYNISLDTVIEYYYNSDFLNPNRSDPIINAVQKHHLFSNILLIKTVSLKLLKDLEMRWSQQKPRVSNLADVILKHAQDSDFQQQYINYLTNQSYQINALKTLLQKENFKNALTTIQNQPKCCKLSLDSFLALPMQRLTRLKLLTEVILKLMRSNDEIFQKIPKSIVETNQNALNKLKELLTSSEENKFKMEQKARLIDLTKILEFSGSCKNIAIGSKELIKEGDVRASLSQISPNVLKKLSKKRQPSFYLIVLSDLVIIAKKKSPTKLLVLDYCEKSKVKAYPPLNSASVSQKPLRSSVVSQISLSSISSNDSTSLSTPAQTFVLEFAKDNDTILTDPLMLSVPTTDIRDQWINAIMSNQ